MSFVIVQQADAATFLSTVATATRLHETSVSITNITPEEFVDYCQQQGDIRFFGGNAMHGAVMNMTGCLMRHMRTQYCYGYQDIAIFLTHPDPEFLRHAGLFVVVAPCREQAFDITVNSTLTRR